MRFAVTVLTRRSSLTLSLILGLFTAATIDSLALTVTPDSFCTPAEQLQQAQTMYYGTQRATNEQWRKFWDQYIATERAISEQQLQGMRAPILFYQYDTGEYKNGWATWDSGDRLRITLAGGPWFLNGDTPVACQFERKQGHADLFVVNGKPYACTFTYTTREKGWFGITHDTSHDYATQIRFCVAKRQDV